MNRKHTWQHHARNVEVTMIEANGFFIGGRCLNRDMALNMGIAFGGILQHGEVGKDQRIGAQLCRHIHRTLPALIAVGVGKGINGDVQLAAVLVHEAHRFL